jgi:hypothetical protein
MSLWAISTLALLFGLRLIVAETVDWRALTAFGKQDSSLKQVTALLHELHETLESGVVPDPGRWSLLAELPMPWGELAASSLGELRAQGGAVLPTLKRLRELAESHQATIRTGKARAAQALAQVWVCAAMVPLFGAALYQLLPGVDEHPLTWALGCVVAVAWAGAGALWLLAMAEKARWAGLSVEQRPWLLVVQCAGERFLAMLRGGSPPDLAWAGACELLQAQARPLAALWGHSVWQESSRVAVLSDSAVKVMASAGNELRKGIQVSLMEGRPCAERAELVLQALRKNLESLVERELGLLGTRAMKPLFLCVAPALLGLLCLALALSWEQAIGAGLI